MTFPLVILAKHLCPEYEGALYLKDGKGRNKLDMRGNSQLTTFGTVYFITPIVFDTVASISTFVCGILGAIGVIKIHAIGSYSMIGVSCSITAAWAIMAIKAMHNKLKQTQRIK